MINLETYLDMFLQSWCNVIVVMVFSFLSEVVSGVFFMAVFSFMC